ncbi:MAG: response regulator [Candidatus Omnitrophica bacterium]|nr:response regulator [Candidatus Omnitrophota bacterium]
MKKILLIEDEPDTIKVVEKRLTDHGFRVVVANDGRKGFELARLERPDLIILDLMLPKIDGHRVCGLLKRDMRFNKVPIIIFTAKAQRRDEELAQELGADAYINKPFEASVLISKIEELLGNEEKLK